MNRLVDAHPPSLLPDQDTSTRANSTEYEGPIAHWTDSHTGIRVSGRELPPGITPAELPYTKQPIAAVYEPQHRKYGLLKGLFTRLHLNNKTILLNTIQLPITGQVARLRSAAHWKQWVDSIDTKKEYNEPTRHQTDIFLPKLAADLNLEISFRQTAGINNDSKFRIGGKTLEEAIAAEKPVTLTLVFHNTLKDGQMITAPVTYQVNNPHIDIPLARSGIRSGERVTATLMIGSLSISFELYSALTDLDVNPHIMGHVNLISLFHHNLPDVERLLTGMTKRMPTYDPTQLQPKYEIYYDGRDIKRLDPPREKKRLKPTPFQIIKTLAEHFYQTPDKQTPWQNDSEALDFFKNSLAKVFEITINDGTHKYPGHLIPDNAAVKMMQEAWALAAESKEAKERYYQPDSRNVSVKKISGPSVQKLPLIIRQFADDNRDVGIIKAMVEKKHQNLSLPAKLLLRAIDEIQDQLVNSLPQPDRLGKMPQIANPIEFARTHFTLQLQELLAIFPSTDPQEVDQILSECDDFILSTKVLIAKIPSNCRPEILQWYEVVLELIDNWWEKNDDQIKPQDYEHARETARLKILQHTYEKLLFIANTYPDLLPKPRTFTALIDRKIRNTPLTVAEMANDIRDDILLYILNLKKGYLQPESATRVWLTLHHIQPHQFTTHNLLAHSLPPEIYDLEIYKLAVEAARIDNDPELRLADMLGQIPGFGHNVVNSAPGNHANSTPEVKDVDKRPGSTTVTFSGPRLQPAYLVWIEQFNKMSNYLDLKHLARKIQLMVPAEVKAQTGPLDWDNKENLLLLALVLNIGMKEVAPCLIPEAPAVRIPDHSVGGNEPPHLLAVLEYNPPERPAKPMPQQDSAGKTNTDNANPKSTPVASSPQPPMQPPMQPPTHPPSAPAEPKQT